MFTTAGIARLRGVAERRDLLRLRPRAALRGSSRRCRAESTRAGRAAASMTTNSTATQTVAVWQKTSHSLRIIWAGARGDPLRLECVLSAGSLADATQQSWTPTSTSTWKSPGFAIIAQTACRWKAARSVERIVTGVTASLALLEAAIAARADALLVHHGYFWRGEDPRIDRHRGGAASRCLIEHDINLFAFHLPLDAHAEVGNNVALARELGLARHRPLRRAGPRLAR